MQWLQDNWALVLWIVCEIMAAIPSLKSSSVGTLIYNLLKGTLGSKQPPALP